MIIELADDLVYAGLWDNLIIIKLKFLNKMKRVFWIIEPGLFGSNTMEFILSLVLYHHLIEIKEHHMVILDSGGMEVGMIESINGSIILTIKKPFYKGILEGRLPIDFPYHQMMMISYTI